MKKNSNLRRIEQTFACRIAREKQNLFVTTLVAQEIENEDFELMLKTSGLKSRLVIILLFVEIRHFLELSKFGLRHLLHLSDGKKKLIIIIIRYVGLL